MIERSFSEFWPVFRGVAALVLIFGCALSARGDIFTDVDGLDGFARRNVLSQEILGRGGHYSFNYDYLFGRKVGAGLGFAYYGSGISDSPEALLVTPVFLNYYFARSATRLFVTGGVNLRLLPATAAAPSSIDSLPVVGMGFEAKDSDGLLFRVAPYLIVGSKVNLSIGVSIGYSFYADGSELRVGKMHEDDDDLEKYF